MALSRPLDPAGVAAATTRSAAVLVIARTDCRPVIAPLGRPIPPGDG